MLFVKSFIFLSKFTFLTLAYCLSSSLTSSIKISGLEQPVVLRHCMGLPGIAPMYYQYNNTNMSYCQHSQHLYTIMKNKTQVDTQQIIKPIISINVS